MTATTASATLRRATCGTTGVRTHVDPPVQSKCHPGLSEMSAARGAGRSSPAVTADMMSAGGRTRAAAAIHVGPALRREHQVAADVPPPLVDFPAVQQPDRPARPRLNSNCRRPGRSPGRHPRETSVTVIDR